MSMFEEMIDALFKDKYAAARQKELERQAERDKYYQKEFVRRQDDSSQMGQPMAVNDDFSETDMTGRASLLAQARAIELAEREKYATTESLSDERTESFLYKPAVENDYPTFTPCNGTSIPDGCGYSGGGHDYGGYDYGNYDTGASCESSENVGCNPDFMGNMI